MYNVIDSQSNSKDTHIIVLEPNSLAGNIHIEKDTLGDMSCRGVGKSIHIYIYKYKE